MPYPTNYANWLLDPSAIPIVLLEATANISGTETPFYMSTGGYVTGASDTPANTVYMPIVATGIQYTETIAVNQASDLTSASSTAGTSSMTGGDIEIYNLQGERDVWLSYAWANRRIKAYIGDPRWPRADFQLIFSGVVSDINSQSNDRINLIMGDLTIYLNVNVNAPLLGGITTNANSAIPITLGECFNVTPLLIDPTTLKYQVHPGPIESIIEVRDNGVPVSNTPTLSTGTFVLNQSPAGAITCSVQGGKVSGTYYNTIAQLITQLITVYGTPGSLFTSADIDSANFTAFDTAHPQPVGMYLTGGENILTTCQTLAASVGAQLIMSRAGLLQLYQITFPVPGSVTSIYQDQMVQFSFEIVGRSAVQAAVKIGYCQNWTVQSSLTTSLPPTDLNMFATAFLTTTSVNPTAQALYNVPEVPIEQDGLLLKLTDATAEATRQVNVFDTPRTTYQFVGFMSCMSLVLGEAVQIFHERYEMSSGSATGMVISLSPDWMTGQVTVQVMI